MQRSRVLPLRLVPRLAVLAAALSACELQPAVDSGDNVVQPPSPNRPVMPVPEPALDREALLLAVIRAASAHAAGKDDVQAQRQLDGRQIEVRIRLGCEGPSSEAKRSGWSFDAEARRLRFRAVPDLSLEDPLIRQLLGEGVEDVEGFWLARPWLLTAACPRTAALAPAEPEAKPAQAAIKKAAERANKQHSTLAAPAMGPARIGIAQIFTEADDRSRRRSGRAYEAARELPEGELPGSQGFDLVLSGRLRARPGGRVIHCGGGSAEAPPHCVASADIDRVWIETPDDGSTIAEWRS